MKIIILTDLELHGTSLHVWQSAEDTGNPTDIEDKEQDHIQILSSKSHESSPQETFEFQQCSFSTETHNGTKRMYLNHRWYDDVGSN